MMNATLTEYTYDNENEEWVELGEKEVFFDNAFIEWIKETNKDVWLGSLIMKEIRWDYVSGYMVDGNYDPVRRAILKAK